VGLGTSGGVGRSGVGIAGGASAQTVVSPNGSAALVGSTSANFNPPDKWFGPTFGAGWVAGVQISFSKATDPGDLADRSGDVSVGYGKGSAMSGDFSFSSTAKQLTLTVGRGQGKWGGALLDQDTAVMPLCNK
jgi:hypothetical protein